jgi:hypothetical protein
VSAAPLATAVLRSDGADLAASAASFAGALARQDLAVLLPYFAPEGLSRALALQSQAVASATVVGAAVRSLASDGADHATTLTAVELATGESLLLARWERRDGTWLVVDLAPAPAEAARSAR